MMRSLLLDDSEIVCSTLSSSALGVLEDYTRDRQRKFEIVVIDEAAQVRGCCAAAWCQDCVAA